MYRLTGWSCIFLLKRNESYSILNAAPTNKTWHRSCLSAFSSIKTIHFVPTNQKNHNLQQYKEKIPGARPPSLANIIILHLFISQVKNILASALFSNLKWLGGQLLIFKPVLLSFGVKKGYFPWSSSILLCEWFLLFHKQFYFGVNEQLYFRL